MSRRNDSDLNARAVNIFRGDIPPPPSDLEHAILGAVRRENAACRGAQLQRPDARRHSARLAVRSRRATVGIALALALLALVCPAYGPSPQPSPAVASMVFTSQCARHGPATSQASDGTLGAHARLVVAGVWSGREAANFNRVLAHFARKTSTSITYAYQTHDIAETLNKRLDRGCPPDVALLPQPGLLRDLATRGDLRPLAASVRRVVRRNYTPRWRRLATVNGKLYGVWFKAANKSTFWFSHRAFKRASVSPPRTWQELKSAATELRAAGIAPFSVAGADGWTLTDWFENVYLATAGPTRYDALARHELSWTHPTVTVALKRLAEVLGHSDWLAGGIRGALNTNFTQSVGHVFGRSQSAAMMYEGDFVDNLIPTRSQVHNSDIGVFPFPSVDQDRPPIVVGGDVAAQFTDNPLARKFMRFLATPQAAMPWARTGGFISPNRSLDSDAYRDTTIRTLASATISSAARFDLSDLQPPSFGATTTQGMRTILQHYLARTSSIHAVTRQLQRAARVANACQRDLRHTMLTRMPQTTSPTIAARPQACR